MRITKITPGSNLRWEGSRFMLPEHRAALKQHAHEKTKIPKHELDEQQLEVFGIVIMDALRHALPLKITFWDDGFYEDIEGYVTSIDTQLKRIKVKHSDDDVNYVNIDCLKVLTR